MSRTNGRKRSKGRIMSRTKRKKEKGVRSKGRREECAVGE
jgi:hypothetical protein